METAQEITGEFNTPENQLNRYRAKENYERVSIVLVKKRDLQTILSDRTIEPKYRFLAWLVTPETERVPDTQAKLAKVLGVDQVTISRWKRDEELIELAAEAGRRLALEYSGSVLKKLTELALGGKIYAIELYLKFVMRFADPSEGGNGNTFNDNRMIVTIGGKPARDLPVGLLGS